MTTLPTDPHVAEAIAGGSAIAGSIDTAPGRAPKRAGRNRVWATVKSILADVSGLVAIVAIWQIWVWVSGVKPIVMPPPAEVFGDIASDPGAYIPDILSTLRSALAGLVFGLVLGVGLALLSWRWVLLKGVITPPVLIVRSVPMMAMIPVFARVVGYNVWTVVVVATLVAYFPAYILTVSGLGSSTQASRDLFAVIGASRRDVMWRLALPSALPNIMTAVRLASVACVVGALIAEYIVGTEGLGYLFVRTRLDYDITRSWGVAVVATVVSITLFVVASRLEKWVRARMT